jgi:hypothetical protein
MSLSPEELHSDLKHLLGSKDYVFVNIETKELSINDQEYQAVMLDIVNRILSEKDILLGGHYLGEFECSLTGNILKIQKTKFSHAKIFNEYLVSGNLSKMPNFDFR